MHRIRATLFFISVGLWTFIIGGLGAPFAFTRKGAIRIQYWWGSGTLALLRVICGVHHEIRGRERLPTGAVIVASKHQSMWDTIIFLLEFKAPAFVFKKELLKVPIYGWFCLKTGMVPTDRDGGAKAVKDLLRLSAQRLQENRSLIIFPQGTRLSPDEDAPYQPGVAGLYKHSKVPVVPVALNSGLVWPKDGVTGRAGKIILEFLDPIYPGLDKDVFMEQLAAQIDPASDRLVAEGRLHLGESGDN